VLTGCPSIQEFKDLCADLKFPPQTGSGVLSKENILFSGLVKLRKTIGTEFLSILTRPIADAQSTCRQVHNVWKYIAELYDETFIFPSWTDIKRYCTPAGHAEDLPGVFAWIDATYCYCDRPKTSDMNHTLYCHYKKQYCCKILVLVAPNGMLLSAWGPYAGNKTDADLLKAVLIEAKAKNSSLWKWLCQLRDDAATENIQVKLGVDAGFPDIEKYLPSNMGVAAPISLRKDDKERAFTVIFHNRKFILIR